jgi:hypothetical protein
MITLNSKYAQYNNGTLKSNVVFPFKSILKDEDNIIQSYVTILDAQIPVSFYIVNYSVLNYQVASTNYSITLLVGYYNANSLITEMQSEFTKNGHSFTITLNSNNGILTFSTSTIFSFLSTSTCSYILGFSSTISSSGNSLLMPFPMNLLGQTQLKICSKALPRKNFDILNSLAIIPISVSSYNLISWENNSSHKNLLM